MEKLSIANKRLKTARDDHYREYDAQIKRLDDKQNLLTARLNKLEKKKLEIAEANGNEDAADDDLVEVKAGGKIISAKRSILTQLKGEQETAEGQSIEQVANFSKTTNAAINAKWASLDEAEDDLLNLKVISRMKELSCPSLQMGSLKTSWHSILWNHHESALASKFSINGQESESPGPSDIEEWNHEDVVAWLNHLEISESVFKQTRATCIVGIDGLKDFGVTRKGTIYLLRDEITKLEKADNESATLIEHSPFIASVSFLTIFVLRALLRRVLRPSMDCMLLAAVKRGGLRK
ncbi:hypothetical protein ACHAXR_006007 [Thalassiosira sp. AJA248-18]